MALPNPAFILKINFLQDNFTMTLSQDNHINLIFLLTPKGYRIIMLVSEYSLTREG